MRLRPTRRLAGVILAAVIVYGFAVNSLLVWLYMVTAILLALIPLGLIGPPMVARAGALRATMPRSRGFDPPLHEDRGRLFAFTQLEIPITGRVDLDRVELGPLILDDGSRLDASAVADTGGAVIRAAAGLRGPLTIVAVELSSTWPFGLLEARRRIPLQLSLLVLPRYTVVTPQRGGGGGIGGEDSHRRGHGEDVIGLREYRPGDSRRQIHWMTTARIGKLMVVERAAPTRAALRLSLRIDPRADASAVELAVHVAASVAASCVRIGRPFRLSLPDGPPEARQWGAALSRLAHVMPAPYAPATQAVSAAVRAEGEIVIIETEAGVHRLPPAAPVEQVEAVLRALL